MATLSVALEALWLTSQLHPGHIPYNEAVSFRKRGPLQVDALRRAFNALVRRYDAWHSVIRRVNGEPALVAQPPAQFALPLIDLSGLDVDAAERRAVRLVGDAARLPFDLGHGPLLRPYLLRFPADEYRLYLAMHHAIFDGVSLARTVLPELVAGYDAACDGRDPPADEASVGYAAFARWERRFMASDRAARRVEYWRHRLTPPPPRLNLPMDGARPGTLSYRGGSLPVRLPAATAAALRARARSLGQTEFQAFGAIWAALLHRLTGETDIVFGTPADLRRRSEFEPVVGYCLSPLVLRVDLSDDPAFGELMLRVRNDLLDGLDQLVPFERIVRDQNGAGGSDGNPIYQTMFVLEPPAAAHDPVWSLHQLDSALADAIGSTKLDLELQLDAAPDGGFAGQLNYDGDLFTRETAQRLIVAWCQMAESVAVDPSVRVSELPLADRADEAAMAGFNATATEPLFGSLGAWFGDVAKRQPDRPAVTAGGLTASYDELHRAALAGAGPLRDAGVGDGDVVAVCLEPSVALVAAALAVVTTGAALLLLNPAEPDEVLRRHASAAGCAAVIVTRGAGRAFEETTAQTMEWVGVTDVATPLRPDVGVTSAADRELPCVVQHASGRGGALSVLSRHAVDTLIYTLVTDLCLGPADTVLSLPEVLYASPCTELWPALLAGARLVLAPADAAADGSQLSTLIRAEGVTVLHATPTRWEALIASGLRPARGLCVLSGGEPLSRALADALLERFRVVWSAFAPGPPGAYCTLGRVPLTGPVTLGRPLANHRAHVVDGRGRPLPIGFAGELLMAGALATLDHPGAGGLRPEPGGSGQARRTGQRARWLADGSLALVTPNSAVS